MKKSMLVFYLLWMIGIINFVVIANNYIITTELTYLTKAETVYITNEASVYNDNSILIHDRFKGVVQIFDLGGNFKFGFRLPVGKAAFNTKILNDGNTLYALNGKHLYTFHDFNLVDEKILTQNEYRQLCNNKTYKDDSCFLLPGKTVKILGSNNTFTLHLNTPFSYYPQWMAFAVAFISCAAAAILYRGHKNNT